MNLFSQAKKNAEKDGIIECHFCHKEFKPDKRNLNRGWGMFCSRSCNVVYHSKLRKASVLERVQLKRDLNLKKLGL